jgi:hypothetical protein
MVEGYAALHRGGGGLPVDGGGGSLMTHSAGSGTTHSSIALKYVMASEPYRYIFKTGHGKFAIH